MRFDTSKAVGTSVYAVALSIWVVYKFECGRLM